MPDRGEISPDGKEIYKNRQYESLPSWQHIKGEMQGMLGKVLSIKITQRGGAITQYNIETNDYYTNLTTHQGLDIILTQIHKKTKKKKFYSPYSSHAYEVFMYMACAYHKVYGRKPALAFPFTELEEWNSAEKGYSLPLENEMRHMCHDWGVSTYLDHNELFTEDENGVWRFISPNKDISQIPGFGIKGDVVILYLRDYQRQDEAITEIYIEKELLPLFMQAFVDNNRSVSGEVVNLNIKKLNEALYETLTTDRKGDDDNTFFKKLYGPLSEEV